MALSDYKAPRETVLIGNTDVKVRGLAIADITEIMGVHLDDLAGVMTIYENAGGSIAPDNILTFGITLCKDAPGLVAHIIAVAADEPDQVDQAASLNMMDQMKLLEAIGRMTFTDINSVKRIAGAVQAQFQALSRQLETVSSITSPQPEQK